MAIIYYNNCKIVLHAHTHCVTFYGAVVSLNIVYLCQLSALLFLYFISEYPSFAIVTMRMRNKFYRFYQSFISMWKIDTLITHVADRIFINSFSIVWFFVLRALYFKTCVLKDKRDLNFFF